MREVLFKNLTSAASRKKDVILKEIFEKDGVVAKTERRCFYFIKEVKRLSDDADLQKWMDSQNSIDNTNKRNFHIMKEHNDGHNEDKVICKIMGSFYAIVNRTVYTIAFLHSFKVVFAKATLAS
ncbi:MAG: hypothetical protein PHT32_05165 [Candidatus Omnitrophica bacterium]|nr:hypothetical protein [Candidatus Omnitrophota bacterium]